jgi:hypothetical protein
MLAESLVGKRRDEPQMEVVMGNGEQAPAKTGLPVLAWVGIGCGALVILAVIVMTVAGFLVANKVKDVAADFEDNPAMATARLIVKLNPELEEVSTDEDEGTITVRNTKTGEIVTVNFADIEEGKFSFTTDEGEVTVDASGVAESGSVNITTDDGSVVYQAGVVSESVPVWVPVYTGTEPANRHSLNTADTVSGGFQLETSDPVAKVLEFYRSALEEAGYAVSVNTFSQDDSQGGMVNGSHEGSGRTVMAILSSENGTTAVNVNYSESP